MGTKFWQIYRIVKMIEVPRSPLAATYLRFLQLARTIQALPDGLAMDANESALLEAIVVRWYEDNPMTVREAINLTALGSPATLHKRISRLREKDLLSNFNLDGDKRAKYLVPTTRTLEYFNQLGRTMHEVQVVPRA